MLLPVMPQGVEHGSQLFSDGLGGYLHPGQWAACRFANSDYNILIWTGATRQGKTRGIVRSGLAHAVRADLPDGDYGLLGQTKSAIVRNIIPYFQLYARLAGEKMTPAFPTAHTDFFRLCGQRWFLFGGEDRRTEGRIMGMSARGFLADEAVLLPREILEAAFSRLSETGAKAWLATNKGGRRHWLRRDYLDNAQALVQYGIKIWPLDTEYGESPFIDVQQSAFIAATQSGVRQTRLIQNEWADVSGMIYGDNIPTWSEASELPGAWLAGEPEIILSIDPGASNMFAANVLYAYRGKDGVKRMLGIAEYIHDPAKDGDRTDAQHVEALILWLGTLDIEHRLASCLSDPENKSLRIALRQAGFDVKSVNKSVAEGIATTRSRMAASQLLFRVSQLITLEQMQGYTWDPDAAERGEDKPLKRDDHCCDLVRYAVMYALPPHADEPMPGQPARPTAESIAQRLRAMRA